MDTYQLHAILQARNVQEKDVLQKGGSLLVSCILKGFSNYSFIPNLDTSIALHKLQTVVKCFTIDMDVQLDVLKNVLISSILCQAFCKPQSWTK